MFATKILRLPFFRRPGRWPGSLYITHDELGALHLVLMVVEKIISKNEGQHLAPPPQSSSEAPEAESHVEQLIDRIWKEYISQIDSCVGEDREVISDYAEILSGQVRELINAVDEINRYALLGKMFRERVLREGEQPLAG